MYEPIVTILAYLGSQRDYSYIDRLGNAIDEVSIMEAVRDAVRAFFTVCEQPEANCPSIDASELEKSLNALTAVVQAKPRHYVVRLARELSLKAYAKIKILEEAK